MIPEGPPKFNPKYNPLKVVCPNCNVTLMISPPYSRRSTGYMFALHKDKQELVLAEIGVYEGENAENILDGYTSYPSKIKKIYLIDPYVAYENYGQPAIDKWKKTAKKRLERFGDKVELIEESSKKASLRFTDEYFDFIHIDANHSYKNVKQDLEVWWPKIKKGGMLSGHDFDYLHREVVWAVTEFENVNNLDLFIDVGEWWFVK